MQCINMWMDYGTMNFKEIKQELYTNAQNLSWAGALYTSLGNNLQVRIESENRVFLY